MRLQIVTAVLNVLDDMPMMNLGLLIESSSTEKQFAIAAAVTALCAINPLKPKLIVNTWKYRHHCQVEQ
jgi:hypothetical protein